MLQLSPLARRRLERFRSNRRGWWSLWLFCALFALTLGGELIANDKPLVLSYQDSLYFPAFKRYTEREFGGELPFQPDYRSEYVQRLIEKAHGWMLFTPSSTVAISTCCRSSPSAPSCSAQRSDARWRSLQSRISTTRN